MSHVPDVRRRGVDLCAAVVVLWCLLAPLGASAEQCTGKVVESAVEEVRGDSQTGPSFVPRIRFTYYAAGKPWESRQFAFHVWLVSRVQAGATAARYPAGSVVTVYYHPNRPEQAVLESENAWVSVALAAWWGFLLLGTVAGWSGVSRAAG